MSLTTGQTIKYKNAVDAVLAQIKKVCQNIDALPSGLPNAFVNNKSWQVASKDVSYVTGNGTTGTFTLTATATVNDTILKAVPSSTVNSQFNSFLTSNGIADNTGELIPFKNLMIFCNVVSAFIATKVVFLTSAYSSNKYVFYNSEATNFPTLSDLTPANATFTADQIKVSFTDLLNCINKPIQHRLVNVMLSYSSSCSSSSSTFIAYMDI